MSVDTHTVILRDGVDLGYLRIVRNNCESLGVNRMTYISAPRPSGSVAVLSIVVEAARRWREARDGKMAVQPHLFTALADKGCSILAPVFDSLLYLFEAAMRRPLRTGLGKSLSDDERMLLDLLDGERRGHDRPMPADGAGQTFETALISTRIMLRKVFALPATI